MKEQILNTTPVQGHCDTCLCTASPQPAAHGGQLLWWVGSSPQSSPTAPGSVSSSSASHSQPSLMILNKYPRVHIAALKFRVCCCCPGSVPQNDSSSTCPHAGLFFAVSTGGGAVGTSPDTPHMPEGPGRQDMLGFLLKTAKFVYTVYSKTQGHPQYGFFFLSQEEIPQSLLTIPRAALPPVPPAYQHTISNEYPKPASACKGLGGPTTQRSINNFMLLQSNQY